MNISLIGAGKLGTALSHAFISAGHRVDIIISKTRQSASDLAAQLDCDWSISPDIPVTSDIVIVSVNDDSLHTVLESIITHKKTIIAHTAASQSFDIIDETGNPQAVFYPLQTFSHGRRLSFKDIPVFLECKGEDDLAKLKTLADSITDKVYIIDGHQRKSLHLAAVFVCNFVNHMLASGEKIVEKEGFDFGILKALIMETFHKAMEKGPGSSQTGPAVRNDINTIEKHIDLLSFSPELQNMYSVVSDSIIKTFSD